MQNESKEDIVRELVIEERMETDMIYIYRSILDAGAANCLPKEKQKQFRKNVEVLYRESEGHSAEVFKLIEKYKK